MRLLGWGTSQGQRWPRRAWAGRGTGPAEGILLGRWYLELQTPECTSMNDAQLETTSPGLHLLESLMSDSSPHSWTPGGSPGE